MTKITIKYENEIDKLRMLQLLSKGSKIKKISESKKAGKYSRVYLDVE